MCDKNITVMRFRELVDKEKSRESIAKKMAEQGLNCNTSTITKHYNGDRTISTEYVIKYAKYFGVSADYLLGLSNVATTNIEIKAICEYTRLSEQALDNLHIRFPVAVGDIIDPNITDFLLTKGYWDYIDICQTLNKYRNLMKYKIALKKELLENKIDTSDYDVIDKYISKFKELVDALDLTQYRLQNKVIGLLNTYISEELKEDEKTKLQFNEKFAELDNTPFN